jgi:hypothetical protein
VARNFLPELNLLEKVSSDLLEEQAEPFEKWAPGGQLFSVANALVSWKLVDQGRARARDGTLT